MSHTEKIEGYSYGDQILNILAFTSLFCGLALKLIGFTLLGDQWMKFDAESESYFTVDKVGDIGIFLIYLGLSLGPIYMGWGLLRYSFLQAKQLPVYITILGLLFCGMVIGVVFSFTELITPFSKYIWYQGQEGDAPKLNTLNQLLGGMIVSIYIPLAISLLYLIIKLNQLYWNQGSIKKSLNPRKIVQFNNKFYNNLYPIGIIVLSYYLFFILSMILPHVWAITVGNQIAANRYFVEDSTSSVVHGVLWYKNTIDHYILTNDTNGNLYYAPDPDWLQPMVYLKLYPDVIVYYSMIATIMIVGLVATYTTYGRRLLHTRVDVNHILHKSINIWPTGICYGEILLVSAVVALHAYWFWFWAKGWIYRDDTVDKLDKGLQIYARVMGEMTVLTMSFLTVPITHNNVWEAIFGVPFDRMVKYHRLLGGLTWLFVSLHMWLWQILWIKNGTLANNAYDRLNHLIISGTMDNPGKVRENNFTIPLMETLWLLSSLALIAAGLRKYIPYEIFQYSHYFMIMFFLMSFIHSFQSWYFTGGGLLLYLYDKCLRLIQSSQYLTIDYIKHHSTANITRIIISKADFQRHYMAGQFCWIQIPAVSAFEWHPFTISSCPSMKTIEFSILNMGDRTWTGRLAELAKNIELKEKLTAVPDNTSHRGTIFDRMKPPSLSARDRVESGTPAYTPRSEIPVHTHQTAGGDHNNNNNNSSSSSNSENNKLQILIDGPFGRSLSFWEHDAVILVAGGIGVTPMISILSELAVLRKHRNYKETNIDVQIKFQHLHFIWVVKDIALLNTFHHMLDPIKERESFNNIHLHIYCTSNNPNSVPIPIYTDPSNTQDNSGLNSAFHSSDSHDRALLDKYDSKRVSDALDIEENRSFAYEPNTVNMYSADRNSTWSKKDIMFRQPSARASLSTTHPSSNTSNNNTTTTTTTTSGSTANSTLTRMSARHNNQVYMKHQTSSKVAVTNSNSNNNSNNNSLEPNSVLNDPDHTTTTTTTTTISARTKNTTNVNDDDNNNTSTIDKDDDKNELDETKIDMIIGGSIKGDPMTTAATTATASTKQYIDSHEGGNESYHILNTKSIESGTSGIESRTSYDDNSNLVDIYQSSKSPIIHTVEEEDFFRSALSKNIEPPSYNINAGRPDLNIVFQQIIEDITHKINPALPTIDTDRDPSLVTYDIDEGRYTRKKHVKSTPVSTDPTAAIHWVRPSIACLVCGPKRMIDSVSELSYKYDFHFQAEEFNI